MLGYVPMGMENSHHLGVSILNWALFSFLFPHLFFIIAILSQVNADVGWMNKSTLLNTFPHFIFALASFHWENYLLKRK